MWPQTVAFVKERPLVAAVAVIALFFSWPAILLGVVVASPVLAPAALLAAVRALGRCLQLQLDQGC